MDIETTSCAYWKMTAMFTVTLALQSFYFNNFFFFNWLINLEQIKYLFLLCYRITWVEY